jgi:plasmid stability protein
LNTCFYWDNVMASILISELEGDALARLRDRAAASGRSVEDEAKALLETALQSGAAAEWDSVAAIRDRLRATGRSFGDSAELVREDRDR